MRILITHGGGYVHTSGAAPEEGKTYLLEDATNGSLAQNKAFHALIGEYWKSGAHSYNANSFEHFRDLIKLNLGAGAECFVYASPEGIQRAKTLDEVPEEYRTAKYCMTKLKSWTDYTLKERRETMDRLISEMHQVGVNTKKFYEILDGMA